LTQINIDAFSTEVKVVDTDDDRKHTQNEVDVFQRDSIIPLNFQKDEERSNSSMPEVQIENT